MQTYSPSNAVSYHIQLLLLYHSLLCNTPSSYTRVSPSLMCVLYIHQLTFHAKSIGGLNLHITAVSTHFLFLLPLSLPVLCSGRRLHHRSGQLFLLLLSPPLATIYLCSLYLSLLSDTPSSDLGAVLMGGAGVAGRGLVLSYNSWFLFGAWLFPVGCLVVWPAWLMGWRLSCHQVKEEEEDTNISSSHPHSD